MTPEGKELAKVIKWLKQRKISGQLNFIRLALQPGVSRGWPDLLVILPHGMTLWIEMKRPGAEPAPMQQERMRELLRLHHLAGWFDSADAAIASIAQALDAVALHEKGRQVPSRPPRSGPAAGAGRP